MQTLTFTEALEVFNNVLTEAGETPMCETEFKDWVGDGENLTDAEVEGWAKDLLSEIRTEKCAAKNAWMYEH
jgi:hypothetical protein